jgi:probable sporulation protein (polysaccharide deacetylase family)
MKIIFIKYKVLYIIGFIAIVLAAVLLYVLLSNNAVETFENNDIFYRGNVNDKIIAFTCNVDWGNEYIPPMIEIFKENNIYITFFITGRWAENNQDLVKLIYNNGHEIGNHGYLHRDYSLLSYDMNRREIEKADKIIRKIIGKKPNFFAPPAGAYNKETVKAAKDLGYDVIMWSIDTIDWRSDSTKEKIIERVTKKAHNSAIVLMHPKEQTVKALPTIISKLREEGYKIGKVSEIIR